MEPERRCKSGMDGGLTAASLVTSPPLYLRTAVFLSKQLGPPLTPELNDTTKRDSLDHLATIGEQVVKPPDKRRIATFTKAIEGLSTVATTVMKLMPLYEQLMKLLADHKIVDKLGS